MTKVKSPAVRQTGPVRGLARGSAATGLGAFALVGPIAWGMIAAPAAMAQPAQPMSSEQPAAGRSGRPQVVQLLNRPPANVPADAADPINPGQEPGDAGLLVRIDHLENQIRALNGQIEQLQFQQRRLEEVLRKVQQDTDVRFQELQGRGGLAPAAPPVSPIRPPIPSVSANGAAAVSPSVTASAGPGRRSDAFDPSTQPDAPGAPRPLGGGGAVVGTPGAAASVPPDGDDPNAPMDIMHSGRPRIVVPTAPGPPETTPSQSRSSNTASASAAAPTAGRDEFELGRGLFRQGQYEAAQNAFTAFLQKSPKDVRVPDATYWLGETYSQRGRHTEAAEQYLKLSTDYPKSLRAPDGLLRLGMSLSALGAKEQACATFQEVGRKYPTASAGVKSGVERELKRTKC